MITVKVIVEVIDTEGKKSREPQELMLKNVCLVGMQTKEEPATAVLMVGGFSIMDYIILHKNLNEDIIPRLNPFFVEDEASKEPLNKSVERMMADLFKEED